MADDDELEEDDVEELDDEAFVDAVLASADPALWTAARKPKAATDPALVAATDAVIRRRRRRARSRRWAALTAFSAGDRWSLLVMHSCSWRRLGSASAPGGQWL